MDLATSKKQEETKTDKPLKKDQNDRVISNDQEDRVTLKETKGEFERTNKAKYQED